MSFLLVGPSHGSLRLNCLYSASDPGSMYGSRWTRQLNPGPLLSGAVLGGLRLPVGATRPLAAAALASGRPVWLRWFESETRAPAARTFRTAGSISPTATAAPPR